MTGRGCRLVLTATFALLAACNIGNPEQRLIHAAEEAVTDDIDSGSAVKFEDVKGVASSHLACGHFIVRDSRGHVTNEKDFVYKDGKTIYDDNPTYPSSVIECYEELDTTEGNTPAIATNGS